MGKETIQLLQIENNGLTSRRLLSEYPVPLFFENERARAWQLRYE